MKSLFLYTALALAILFLAAAALACLELLQEENPLTSPKLKPALGFLVSGLMFLGIALRGWRTRRRTMELSDRSS